MQRVSERYFAGQDDNYIEPPASDLEEVLSDVTFVSRILHGIENGGDLSAETLCDLCVCLFNAERRLTDMLKAEGGTH